MKVLALAALCAALFVCAGCGAPTPLRKLPPAHTTAPCHPRTPPSAGECVGQHFGITQPAVGLPGSLGRPQGVDISQWQGYRPNLSGLRFVIIQANYGTHVEPSVFSQLADAKASGVPYGCYTFLEPGVSGEAQAQLAHRLCPGAPLGLWADAELNGTYQHACSYTAEAKRLGSKIAGLYTSPGLWPGGVCQGYLWAAEWGGSAYAFAGYSRAALAVRQYSGFGRRFGVTVDLDEDLGLLALAHPSPPPISRSKRRALVLADLHRHGCFHIHGRAAFRLCPYWGAEWRRLGGHR